MSGGVCSKLEMHPSLKQHAARESLSLAVMLPLRLHHNKSFISRAIGNLAFHRKVLNF